MFPEFKGLVFRSPLYLCQKKTNFLPPLWMRPLMNVSQAKTKTKFAVGHRSIVVKSSAYGAKGAGFQNPVEEEKFICVIVYLYVL